MNKTHKAEENCQTVKRLHDRMRGFALIELLVVIAIIAVLAAIALPNFLGIRAKLAPEFPWPPPRASAFDIVPRELLLGNKQTPLLGDADAALDSAFRQAGYGEKSYYGVPEGFAMASRIEQINQDGTAKEPADRWSVEVAPLRKWSLRAYLERLFKANPGYYRVIVFIVTSQPFSQSNTKATEGDVGLWVSNGLNKLPVEIASRQYSSAHTCTALIYEFRRTGGQPAEFMDPPIQMTGQTHLEKSGLLAALKKQPSK